MRSKGLCKSSALKEVWSIRKHELESMTWRVTKKEVIASYHLCETIAIPLFEFYENKITESELLSKLSTIKVPKDAPSFLTNSRLQNFFKTCGRYSYHDFMRESCIDPKGWWINMEDTYFEFEEGALEYLESYSYSDRHNHLAHSNF